MRHRYIDTCVSVLAGILASSAAFASDDQEVAPAASAAATSSTDSDYPLSDIIVTGTRSIGARAVESAAPIKVLGSETMERVGQPNLNQVLTQLVPSFTTEAFGVDTANLTLAAKLRGLSPNHTLVLVNGKRRHGTANLHVLAGPYQGGASADLDLLTAGAIDHIEVLEDGAAAQYGSDAIAGVINVILKHDRSGGNMSVTGGQYYKGDGETYAGTLSLAQSLGENGFIDLTLFHRFHDFSARGGLDTRVTTIDGSPLATAPTQFQNIPGYPYINKVRGDGRSRLTTVVVNAGYDLGGVQLYAFGTYGRRTARTNQIVRLPNLIVASPVLGIAGSYTDPTSLIFAPRGFIPQEGLVENDYAVTGGAKGSLGDWRWDISTTYGQDKNSIYTYNNANRSLFIDTHFTPRTFFEGRFTASEWTSNLDLSRELEIGLSAPMTLAFGAEYREQTYVIDQGDAASIYKEGNQAYPGFRPQDTGDFRRDNYAVYVDVAFKPVEKLKLDVAGRYERYSDFGGELNGKLTGRYDFTDMVAIRGTVSSGFRAPTLPESNYSATNVSPTQAIIQLPANTAAAKLVGIDNLKPEKSVNLSAGLVLRPARRLAVTVDAYQVSINDRIAASGIVFGSQSGVVLNPNVINAINARGYVLDSTVGLTGVSVFTNGLDTRTRGVDLTATYLSDFGEMGTVNWTVSANYNQTKITKIRPAPSQLNGAVLYDLTARSFLETGSPRARGIIGAFWSIGDFSLNARATGYGSTTVYFRPNATTPYVKNHIGFAVISDLELGYAVNKSIDLAFGANNLFDKSPPNIALTPAGAPSDGRPLYKVPQYFSPYGINGGYYYARITAKF